MFLNQKNETARTSSDLDVMSAEVLIEATVAEVTLNDSLSYGVRWFFQKGASGVSLADSSGPLSTSSPGFNYVFGLPNAQVAINALESVTDVEIIRMADHST